MSTIANRHAIASYQPSWTSYERQVVRVEREPARPRRWGPAIVGLLLAGAAGVYGYRQLTGPAADTEEAGPNAGVAELPTLPEHTFGPLAAPVTIAVPVNPAPREQAIAPTPAPVPRPAGVVTSRPIARPSFEDAFRGDPARSIPAPPSAARIAEAAISEAPARTLAEALDTQSANPAQIAPMPELAIDVSGDDAAGAAAETLPVLAEDSSVQQAPPGLARLPEPELAADEVALPAMEQPAEPGVQLAEAGTETPDAPGDAAVSDEVAIARSDAAPEIERADLAPGAPRDAASERRPVQLALRAERALARPPAGEAAPVGQPPQLARITPAPAPMAAASAPEEAGAPPAYVQHFPLVVWDGKALGAITVRVFAGDQNQIHLGALLSLFKLRMDAAEYERLISSASADRFVNLEVLREAGLDVRYDARRERLVIGSPDSR